MAPQPESLYLVSIEVLSDQIEWRTNNPRTLDFDRHLADQRVRETRVLDLLKKELPDKLKDMPIGEKKPFTTREPVSWNGMKPLS
jgi:hypothetical protein